MLVNKRSQDSGLGDDYRLNYKNCKLKFALKSAQSPATSPARVPISFSGTGLLLHLPDSDSNTTKILSLDATRTVPMEVGLRTRFLDTERPSFCRSFCAQKMIRTHIDRHQSPEKWFRRKLEGSLGGDDAKVTVDVNATRPTKINMEELRDDH